MKIKLISILLAIGMMLSQIQSFTVQAATTIKIGDYVQMGKYYDESILWRCVDIDENGPLLLSDKVLTIKPFDAKGIHKYLSGTNQLDMYYVRTNYGSNLWETSNMRSWLNSTDTAGNVKWLDGCPPTINNVSQGLNSYSGEKGFMANGNFTEGERNCIRSVSQKSILNKIDVLPLNAQGTEVHAIGYTISTVVQNYDTTAYNDIVTDKIFLLDVKQVNRVYQNLGSSYYIGQPTQKAIDNSGYFDGLTTNTNCHYWLRTPDSSEDNPDHVRIIASNGYVAMSLASDCIPGVRPAFYLNLSSATFSSGSGAKTTPYIVKESIKSTSWNVESITKTTNAINISISTSLTDVQNYPTLFLGIYDNNNKPIKFSKLTTEQNKTIYNFDISGISGIKRAKAFLWEDTSTILPASLTLEYIVN